MTARLSVAQLAEAGYVVDGHRAVRRELGPSRVGERLVPRHVPEPQPERLVKREVGTGLESKASTPAKSKYRNVKRLGPSFIGDSLRLYDSAWGAEVARQLRDEMSAGQVRRVHPEVSIVIGHADDGREVRARVDFLVIADDGRPVIVEAKGFETPNGRTKRAVLKAQGWEVQTRFKRAGGGAL